MIFRFAIRLALPWLLAPLLAHAVLLESVPANPKPFEPVFIRITPDHPGHYYFSPKVRMEGGTLVVSANFVIDLPASKPQVALAYAGRLPAGTYPVRAENLPLPPQLTITVAGASAENIEFSGHWWNPAEPGWGLSLSRGPSGALFAAWFTYDAAGMPDWYTVEPGLPAFPASGAGGGYEGPILRASVPRNFAGLDYSRFSQAPIGTASIFLTSPDSILFVTTIDGKRTERTLVRLPVD